MRLLMLNNEFPPLGGGMGTVNQALLECYAGKMNLEIDLVTSALGGTREIEQFARHIKIIKVPIWNKNIHHCTSRELMLYAVQALRTALNIHHSRPYDFCLAWSTVPAGAVALALNRFIGLPYFVWVSGPDIPGFERRYRFLYPFLLPLLRQIWRKATDVVAKCAGEIDMIRSIESRVQPKLIPNGVDTRFFQPVTTTSEDGPLQVICVARLIERKGQGQLIKAIKRLSDEQHDVILNLVGTGDLHQDYKNLARQLGVQDRVRFSGYIPRERINICYNSAHVFVLPSYNEGMSLAALEAMAAGLPLIVTRTGGTEELVEEGVNGFAFDWGNDDQLVNCLRSFVKDRDLSRRMGFASYTRATNFSWDVIADQFLELFNKIVPQSF